MPARTEQLVERACSAVRRRRPSARHQHPQLTWQSPDRGPKRDAKSDAMRIEEEMQSRGPLTTCRGKQVVSSQQEQGESSKVRRIMGRETWTAEEEPGAEEVALERKKQHCCSRSARCWRRQHWRISHQQSWCTPRSQGQSLTHRLWLHTAENSCRRLRRRQSSWCRMTSPWLGESESRVSGLMTTPLAKPR